jgi:hypothetical protein
MWCTLHFSLWTKRRSSLNYTPNKRYDVTGFADGGFATAHDEVIFSDLILEQLGFPPRKPVQKLQTTRPGARPRTLLQQPETPGDDQLLYCHLERFQHLSQNKIVQA